MVTRTIGEVATADAGSMVTSVCLDDAAIDGDGSAVGLVSVTDSCRIFTTSGIDITAMDDNSAGSVTSTAANACMAQRCFTFNYQSTIILCLAIDVQLIIILNLDEFRCKFGTVTENQVVLAAFYTMNLVDLHVTLDNKVTGTKLSFFIALQLYVVAIMQNLGFSLNGLACIVPRALDVIDLAVGEGIGQLCLVVVISADGHDLWQVSCKDGCGVNIDVVLFVAAGEGACIFFHCNAYLATFKAARDGDDCIPF